jgi:hypothetical protein
MYVWHHLYLNVKQRVHINFDVQVVLDIFGQSLFVGKLGLCELFQNLQIPIIQETNLITEADFWSQ